MKKIGTITKKGYLRLSINGKQKFAHIIEWEKHFGTIPNGYQVHHKDNDKLNNNIDNLILLSALEHKRIHSGCYINENKQWIKPCRKCGEHKEINENYYLRKSGISPWCKECCKKASTENKREKRKMQRF